MCKKWNHVTADLGRTKVGSHECRLHDFWLGKQAGGWPHGQEIGHGQCSGQQFPPFLSPALLLYSCSLSCQSIRVGYSIWRALEAIKNKMITPQMLIPSPKAESLRYALIGLLLWFLMLILGLGTCGSSLMSGCMNDSCGLLMGVGDQTTVVTEIGNATALQRLQDVPVRWSSLPFITITLKAM